MEALGADLQVRKATPKQHASARHDDILVVGMRCARVGESSIVFEGGVFRDEHLLVSGKLAHVVAGASTQTSRFAAHALRAVFDAIAGGSDSSFGRQRRLGVLAALRRRKALRMVQVGRQSTAPASIGIAYGISTRCSAGPAALPSRSSPSSAASLTSTSASERAAMPAGCAAVFTTTPAG